MMREIQIKDAKATLSAVVDEALGGNPAIITRHGKREAVIVSFAEWEKLTNLPSFARLLMSAPIEETDIPERNQSPLRAVEF